MTPPEPSYDQVVGSLVLIITSIAAYLSRKTHKQIKPSNGHRTAELIEEIRDNQILIQADMVKLKQAHISMSQNLATHLVEDREAFAQLGVIRPEHPTQSKPGRRK